MMKFCVQPANILGLLAIVAILHTPFVLKSAKANFPDYANDVSANLPAVNNNGPFRIIYDSLRLSAKGLASEAFDNAIAGYTILRENGELDKDDILTIADFTQLSSQKRLFVIDLKNCKLLYNTYVAHGENSGKGMATLFSNKNESLQSSPGFYVTAGTFDGKHGFSMKLKGMEKNINDKAEERGIIMHSANYVSETFIRSHGYLGRSWGCPAVLKEMNKPIISKIKNGSCLFIYSKCKNYFKQSALLKSV